MNLRNLNCAVKVDNCSRTSYNILAFSRWGRLVSDSDSTLLKLAFLGIFMVNLVRLYRVLL